MSDKLQVFTSGILTKKYKPLNIVYGESCDIDDALEYMRREAEILKADAVLETKIMQNIENNYYIVYGTAVIYIIF